MRDLKVALHGINKALEPNRKPREEAKYIIRQGVTYQLSEKDVWIDAEAFDQALALESLNINENPEKSKQILRYATELYKDYGVESIIRIGSCGAVRDDIKVRDIIVGMSASTDSNVNRSRMNGCDLSLIHI